MNIKSDFNDAFVQNYLARLDFEYFLQFNFKNNNYSTAEKDILYKAHSESQSKILLLKKANKKQAKYLIKHHIRSSYNGGILPSLFLLNDFQELEILDFDQVGEVWAYFSAWQKNQKKIIRAKMFWDLLTKIGSLLAIILTFIKITEWLINS